MSTPTIDPEFRDLLPALATEEYAKLEANILRDGCREPIVLWQGLIADGHNRFEICTRKNVGFQTNHLTTQDFPDRNAIMLWMLENQGGRRNLSDIDRISMARKKEVIIAAQAKEQQIRKPESVSPISAKQTVPIHTREEAAKSAGVGKTKYDEGKVILDAVATGEAPKELLEKVRANEVSIHKAASEIKESRKPAPDPAPPDDEYTAPDPLPKLGKFTLDQTGQFMPEILILIRKISPKDIKFASALNEIIITCQKRLDTKK